nr:GDSL-type esterase/lipase family protein [uncultured Mediterraneibacter sp.]
MNRMTRKTKRNILLCASAVVIMILIILIVQGIRGLMNSSADTSAGLDYIRQEEEGNVAEIEAKISRLDAQSEGGEEVSRSLKERFAGAAVIGDSVAQGFAEFNVLNSSNVTAQIGAHLTQLDDQIESAKQISPTVVFLSIGANDVTSTNGDAGLFTDQYTEVLEEIRREMPEANVFVNSIFPARQKAIDKEPLLEKIPEYNAALKELCDSMNIGFIDNTELVREEYYEQDGQHFKAEFYPIWAEHMAEVAAL